ncbi:MAG: transposase [Candidatus Jettenia sp. CY-1]|nr:MAG: transposase [Candidatus Jettenia sp. CY-1]
MLEYRDELFVFLKGQCGKLFGAKYDVLLYDLTSTYFESDPLAYEVYPGNTRDTATLGEFLDRIEKQYGKFRRTWLVDRGIPMEDIKDAKIWQHGNRSTEPHPRDETIRHIRSTSLRQWKESVGYHIRSLVENAIFRLKTIFGDKLHARSLAQQRTEVGIKASVLNRMMKLGMPESYAIA